MTAIIVAGNVTKDIRIVTLGLPILLVDVCFQLLVMGLMRMFGASAPFRISSVNKGDRIRSGVYAIAEDIVAVDGKQGQAYRRQLESRYIASPTIQNLCMRLDILWGVSGLVVAAICFALIFSLHERNVAYLMGMWALTPID